MTYYLWNGIGAIEDLDCSTLDEAVQELNSKVIGDWTLWQRDGMKARLVAINLPDQREIRTGRFGRAGIFEEFVFE
jgi:hypothetical protein